MQERENIIDFLKRFFNWLGTNYLLWTNRLEKQETTTQHWLEEVNAVIPASTPKAEIRFQDEAAYVNILSAFRTFISRRTINKSHSNEELKELFEKWLDVFATPGGLPLYNTHVYIDSAIPNSSAYLFELVHEENTDVMRIVVNIGKETFSLIIRQCLPPDTRFEDSYVYTSTFKPISLLRPKV